MKKIERRQKFSFADSRQFTQIGIPIGILSCDFRLERKLRHFRVDKEDSTLRSELN